jgi:hypothetical protein
VKRFTQHSLWRWCGTLLVLCLLLPLVVCLCAHEDDCAGAPSSCSDCVCLHHGHMAVTPDVPDLAPSCWFDRAVPPASPERALLLTSAIFRPPIA